MVSSETIKVGLTYDLGIPLLGRYAKEFKAGVQRDICTPMFTILLFIIKNKNK